MDADEKPDCDEWCVEADVGVCWDPERGGSAGGLKVGLEMGNFGGFGGAHPPDDGSVGEAFVAVAEAAEVPFRFSRLLSVE